MKGFSSIKIENGEKPGTQKVTVVTDGSSEVTKEDAIASLGDKASRFVVVTWDKQEAEAEGEKKDGEAKEKKG